MNKVSRPLTDFLMEFEPVACEEFCQSGVVPGEGVCLSIGLELDLDDR